MAAITPGHFCPARRVSCDIDDRGFRQLGARVIDAYIFGPSPALSQHIGNIFSLRSGPQVGRINTCWIVARVQQVSVRRCFAMSEGESHPMRPRKTSIRPSELPISTVLSRTPIPAFVGSADPNLGPEAHGVKIGKVFPPDRAGRDNWFSLRQHKSNPLLPWNAGDSRSAGGIRSRHRRRGRTARRALSPRP